MVLRVTGLSAILSAVLFIGSTSYSADEDSPEAKLEKARKLVDGLPKPSSERTARILLEFRKLNHTVDETELWCLLMRELVTIGRDAVPQLSAELDLTTENRMLRRLGFALRAIGDPRAVPALIRAIPKTLLPSSSDYGLIVGDEELTAFMQKHDLSDREFGRYFDLGRPEREIIGALQHLTGQDFNDAAINMMSLSEDPRRRILQRRIFGQQAKRWQTWWETNSGRLTSDAAYQKVNLEAPDRPLPPLSPGPSTKVDIGNQIIGLVLSPPTVKGRHCYDLDTGYAHSWPMEIPRNEATRDAKQLEDWSSKTGVDLICVTHRLPDGTATYVLQALGMKVQEIRLDQVRAAEPLPEGRPVGDLLMHFDTESKRLVPDANAVFFFTTREGNMGVIETTDRVTRVEDLTGMIAGRPPLGVGFHKGVRFNLTELNSPGKAD